MDKKLRSIIYVFVLGLLVLVISACSAGESSDEGPDDKDGGTTAPKSGGTYTILTPANRYARSSSSVINLYTYACRISL